MPEKGRGRWQALLADQDVKRWFDNLARGSQATADNYLRILGRFLNMQGLDPKSFIALQAKEREDVLADYIQDLLDKGRAGSTMAVVKKAVVSWLDWNGLQLQRRIKIPGVNKRPTLKDAHIPTQEELKRVLNTSDSRARLAISLIAFSGLRLEVLGSYNGSDGLRLRDLPEIKIEEGNVVVEQAPTLVRVPEDLSKVDHAYFTFLGHEGCDYLVAHLTERREAGEAIGPDTPIISPKNIPKPFMRTINIGDLVRKPMRAAGLKEPPYMWRSYFASRCMLAEGEGLLRDYRQFFMGHRGDIEHVYALHKQLPPDTVEKMRAGYEAALRYLETQQPRRGQDPSMKLVLAMLREVGGYSKEDLENLDLDAMDHEEIVELLRKRGHRDAPVGPSQQILPMDRLSDALGDGWMFRAALPDGRAVVERGPGFLVT